MYWSRCLSQIHHYSIVEMCCFKKADDFSEKFRFDISTAVLSLKNCIYYTDTSWEKNHTDPRYVASLATHIRKYARIQFPPSKKQWATRFIDANIKSI